MYLASPREEEPRGVRVVYMDGSRLSGELVKVEKTALSITSPGFAGPVRLPVAGLRSLVVLRHAGIRAELYLGSGKFGPQIKYADRRNSPCVVIQGSDEKARGEVTIKDLIVGAELAKLEKGSEQHLQKQAEAQRSVPEDKLVETVREVLAKHGLTPR